ncbi:MAG: hypothetical protein JNL87_05475 [Burkholderiaceae bacterium]|nr:hypothetical protein [Burkholderiaceae bacterium]
MPGNHEFYGGSIDGTLDKLERLCRGTRVRLRQRDPAFDAGFIVVLNA